MNRPYTAYSPYSLTPTERLYSQADGTTDDTDYRHLDDGLDVGPDEGLHKYGDYRESDDPDEYGPIDRRWLWIAGVAGAILLVAVLCTMVILGGGDSGSVSTTVAPPAGKTPATAAPSPVAPTPSALPPAPALAPETVTTVAPTTDAAPSATPPAASPSAPPPNSITYRVFGNRSLLDLVTVIYTDQQGALQTDVNVALPWTKTVVLDPGVTLTSVTATSLTGQLNCSVTDAGGALIAEQNTASMIATCTK